NDITSWPAQRRLVLVMRREPSLPWRESRKYAKQTKIEVKKPALVCRSLAACRRSSLHANAGTIQLDVNCEQAELRVKIGAHTAGNCIELEERFASTRCKSRSFNHANSVTAHARTMICRFSSQELLFYGFVRSDFAIAYVDDAVRVLRDV